MTPRLSRSAIIALVFTALCVLSHPANAQTSVDPTYNGVPSVNLVMNGSLVVRQAVQTDGKILVWGGAFAAEGVAKGRLFRLNPDGTLDNTFTYCHCVLDGLNNAIQLPDGKTLVAGSEGSGSKVIRLNSDGSLDPTFNNPTDIPGAGGLASVTIQAVQPDGRFFISRVQAFTGFSYVSVHYFNADGSPNAAFTPVAVSSGAPPGFTTQLSAFELLPDGRFWIAKTVFGAGTGSGDVRRYTATGAFDPTWEAPIFTPGSGGGVNIGDIEPLPDGSLVVVGTFDTVNGVARPDIVRLMPAGNVDFSFVGPTYVWATRVEALSNGKLLVAAVTEIFGPTSLFRLNADGSPDGIYASNFSPTGWVIDSADRVLFGTADNITRLLADGAPDGSFNTNIGLYGRIHAMARQSDGKVIVAGEFIKFNGVATTAKFVRTNADGTLDPTYGTGTGFNAIPTKMIAQPDGKLLVIGPFTQYNGMPVPGIVRLMPDGTVDPLFSVIPNAGGQIHWIELLADGRFYIGGTFSTINSTARAGAARLHNDGTLDHGFNALIGALPNITAVVAQPDGKVLIGGSFTGIGGFNRSGFARVDSSGALDQSFNPTNTSAARIYLAPDAKILTTSTASGGPQAILRRNSNGSTDPSFTSVNFFHSSGSGTVLDSLLARADGSVIVGGLFDRLDGTTIRSGIVRLAPNGTLDQSFLPNSADGRVRTMIDAGTDKILLGGAFTRIENTTRPGLARVNVAPLRKITPFDFDGDGRADFAVFRPSTSSWYTLQTSDWQYTVTGFGTAGDIVTPPDYVGDGKTDLGIYRPASGQWWYAASTAGGAHRAIQQGVNGDIPRPADFDGDGKADFVVFRPSNNTWYRMGSLGSSSSFAFGAAGDIPVRGDFDGDGKADYAIFRPSTGTWWYAASSASNQHRAILFGQNGDVPVPGDYDGDGKTDVAIYRPSEGGWYVTRSSNGTFITTAFGISTDRPIPADYDGDGATDIAVFRPSTGVWYLLQSTAGSGGVQWGASTDIAIPGAFVP